MSWSLAEATCAERTLVGAVHGMPPGTPCGRPGWGKGRREVWLPSLDSSARRPGGGKPLPYFGLTPAELPPSQILPARGARPQDDSVGSMAPLLHPWEAFPAASCCVGRRAG